MKFGAIVSLFPELRQGEVSAYRLQVTGTGRHGGKHAFFGRTRIVDMSSWIPCLPSSCGEHVAL
eukprot:1159838-Pelagomonas_calceolata.AAC.4